MSIGEARATRLAVACLALVEAGDQAGARALVAGLSAEELRTRRRSRWK